MYCPSAVNSIMWVLSPGCPGMVSNQCPMAAGRLTPGAGPVVASTVVVVAGTVVATVDDGVSATGLSSPPLKTVTEMATSATTAAAAAAPGTSHRLLGLFGEGRSTSRISRSCMSYPPWSRRSMAGAGFASTNSANTRSSCVIAYLLPVCGGSNAFRACRIRLRVVVWLD